MKVATWQVVNIQKKKKMINFKSTCNSIKSAVYQNQFLVLYWISKVVCVHAELTRARAQGPRLPVDECLDFNACVFPKVISSCVATAGASIWVKAIVLVLNLWYLLKCQAMQLAPVKEAFMFIFHDQITAIFVGNASTSRACFARMSCLCLAFILGTGRARPSLIIKRLAPTFEAAGFLWTVWVVEKWCTCERRRRTDKSSAAVVIVGNVVMS